MEFMGIHRPKSSHRDEHKTHDKGHVSYLLGMAGPDAASPETQGLGIGGGLEWVCGRWISTGLETKNFCTVLAVSLRNSC